jgi:hypothetical protein
VTDARRVAIIGAELDLGAGRRGVDIGPSAIRYAGLGVRLASLGISSEDWGNVYAPLRETTETGNPTRASSTRSGRRASGSPSACAPRSTAGIDVCVVRAMQPRARRAVT